MAKTIAISAGHSSKCRGACPPYMDEVDEARKVCTKLANNLEAMGCVVHGPFFDDVSTSQNENLNRIVNWHNSLKRNLDISVHLNANTTTSNPMGTECLYITQEDLARKVSAAIASAGKFKDRGAKYRSDLFVLNNTTAPCILAEICFVDSSADKELLYNNHDAICRAFAEAVSDGEDLPSEPPEEPSDEWPTIGLGDHGSAVESVQHSLGLPVDGEFGPVTEAGVKAFQRAWNVPGGADGIVGSNTWDSLSELDSRMDLGTDGISDELADQIDELAAASSLQSFSWPDRGRAPEGYYAGMAKCFALASIHLRDGTMPVLVMAQASTADPDTDALAYYAYELNAAGLVVSNDGINTLRALFVLMTGLAMRESSGNHWCGRDMSATNIDSDTCEAGLLQTSWNIETCDKEAIDPLLERYTDDPNGFRETFGRGNVYPTVNNLDCYGSSGSNGVMYQWLAKFSPAFAVAVTGVGLRKRRQHWGPVNRREVDIVPAVNDLLMQVQRLVFVDTGIA